MRSGREEPRTPVDRNGTVLETPAHGPRPAPYGWGVGQFKVPRGKGLSKTQEDLWIGVCVVPVHASPSRDAADGATAVGSAQSSAGMRK